MAVTLSPRPGFDWIKIRWRMRQADDCSYCGGVLREEDVPLVLYRDNGTAAEFCIDCQRTWWGMESFPEPEGA